jgi:small subunit ribosomal protein S6
MPLYEHVFIARQDISPQQVEALTDQLKGVIKEGGGDVQKAEYWGLRTLTYRIKKNRKGHYSLLNIDAPHEAVSEMERQMRINEDVLRFMTLRVDELEEGESAMMKSRGRSDDRRPRGDRPPRDNDRPPRRQEERTETVAAKSDAPAETGGDKS